MHAMKIASALAVLSSAAAFKVPVGTANGIYDFGIDEDGSEFSRKVGDVEEASAEELQRFSATRAGTSVPAHRSNRTKRCCGPGSVNSNVGVNCAKYGWTLSGNDVFQAQMALNKKCKVTGDTFVPSEGGRVGVFGNAVVFVCNTSGKSQSCNSTLVDEDITAIMQQCSNAAGESLHDSLEHP